MTRKTCQEKLPLLFFSKNIYSDLVTNRSTELDQQKRRRKFFDFACDVIGFMGFAAIVYGVWQIHQPSAYIVGGVILVILAIMATRAAWDSSDQ